MARDSLLAAWRSARRNLVCELHEVADIFGVPPTFGSAVVVPANEALVGVCYPTFRRGGFRNGENVRGKGMPGKWCVDPTVFESLSDTQSWASPDAPEGTIFYGAESCIDGRAHLLGGMPLKQYLESLPVVRETINGHPVRCEAGGAVITPSLGELRSIYPSAIVHAVSPYFTEDTCWAQELRRCYEQAFEKAFCCRTQAAIEQDRGALAPGQLRPERPENSPLSEGPVSACWAFLSHVLQSWRWHRRDTQQPDQIDTLVCPFLGTGVRGAPMLRGARVAGLAVRQLDERLAQAADSRDRAYSVKFVLRNEGDGSAFMQMAARVVQSFSEGLLDGGNFQREF